MFKKVDRRAKRIKKHKRVRNKIFGTTERPRLNVYRSLNNIFVQIIDDEKSLTKVSASSIDKQIKAEIKNGGNIDAAKVIGKKIAERALEAGITEVVFDRSGYVYTGRVKALAEAAREAGLKF